MKNIDLKGVAETLLVPFYARVLMSQRYPEKFYDAKALEAYTKLDYDCSRFQKAKLSLAGCVARTQVYDKEVAKFLEAHPKGNILSLGCGLSTRMQRLDNGSCHYYGLDFPEVIRLRNQLFPAEERTQLFSCNLFSEEWKEQIPKEELCILLEGILMYFTEEEVKSLLKGLQEAFPKAIIYAEVMRPFTVKYQKHHDAMGSMEANFTWALEKPEDLEKMLSGLKVLEEIEFTKGMKDFAPLPMFFLGGFIAKRNNRIWKIQFE